MKPMSAALCALFLLTTARLPAQEMPTPPEPSPEHKFLQKFVGTWDTKGECTMGPDAPPETCDGRETVTAVGKYWIVSTMKGGPVDPPMTGVMTVGYSPEQKKFVGTWVDSMTTHMWKYEGTLNESGTVLTLEADGPNMMEPGKTAKFRDVTEFKSDDHKVMTSSMQLPDGQWVQFMTMDCRKRAK